VAVAVGVAVGVGSVMTKLMMVCADPHSFAAVMVTVELPADVGVPLTVA
jgi:hypothetical protein